MLSKEQKEQDIRIRELNTLQQNLRRCKDVIELTTELTTVKPDETNKTNKTQSLNNIISTIDTWINENQELENPNYTEIYEFLCDQSSNNDVDSLVKFQLNKTIDFLKPKEELTNLMLNNPKLSKNILQLIECSLLYNLLKKVPNNILPNHLSTLKNHLKTLMADQKFNYRNLLDKNDTKNQLIRALDNEFKALNPDISPKQIPKSNKITKQLIKAIEAFDPNFSKSPNNPYPSKPTKLMNKKQKNALKKMQKKLKQYQEAQAQATGRNKLTTGRNKLNSVDVEELKYKNNELESKSSSKLNLANEIIGDLVELGAFEEKKHNADEIKQYLENKKNTTNTADPIYKEILKAIQAFEPKKQQKHFLSSPLFKSHKTHYPQSLPLSTICQEEGQVSPRTKKKNYKKSP